MKTGLLVFAVLFFIAGFFLAWFVPSAWLSAPEPGASLLAVEIRDGARIDDAAATLAEKGIIASATGYRLYGYLDASALRPKPGRYELKPGMSFRSVARTLAIGPAREEITVTVVEGWTLGDIGTTLASFGVSSTAWGGTVGDRTAGMPFDPSWKETYGFLTALPADATLEGYLFPETYRVWKDQLPQSLVKKQLDEFEKRAPRIADEAKAQGRTLHEVVILASIVEKEVADAEDRKVVAGIFMNRLKSGMPLQSDATVSYLTGSGRARSTLADLETDSPFNTYRNKGLPPAPISNPGDTAIDAALHPRGTEYLYFLTDENGKTYFAKTFEEHQENRRRAFGG